MSFSFEQFETNIIDWYLIELRICCRFQLGKYMEVISRLVVRKNLKFKESKDKYAMVEEILEEYEPEVEVQFVEEVLVVEFQVVESGVGVVFPGLEEE